MPLVTSCTNNQKRIVLLQPVTDPVPGFPGGRPSQIQAGSLKISVRSGDGTFEYDDQLPNQFKAVSGELAGETIYDVSGDADLGTEVATIADIVTLVVSSAQAKNFGFSEGVVEEKVAA